MDGEAPLNCGILEAGPLPALQLLKRADRKNRKEVVIDRRSVSSFLSIPYVLPVISSKGMQSGSDRTNHVFARWK